MKDRKSMKSIELAVKEAEQLVINGSNLDILKSCLGKAAEGMQFQKAEISLFQDNGRLGSDLDLKKTSIGKVISWIDPNQSGYFSRDKEFLVEFPISGRNFAYGKIQYVFIDGRSNLSVQDEVLLERIHDSISVLAEGLGKENYQIC